MTRPTLTEELWAAIEGLYGDILAHPFLVGLGDGSLDHEAFRFYVVQDAHYLRGFARALAIGRELEVTNRGRLPPNRTCGVPKLGSVRQLPPGISRRARGWRVIR